MARSYGFQPRLGAPTRETVYQSFASVIPFSPARHMLREILVEAHFEDAVLTTKIVENMVARDELAVALYQVYKCKGVKISEREIPF